MYEIERNVPFPTLHDRSETISQMNIGDSMVVADNVEAQKMYYTARQMGFMMKRRQLPDDTFRIWRVR